jgi:hypothetical protein
VRLTGLGVAYLVVGVGLAAVAARRGRARGGDLALLVVCWPLYGPSLLLAAQPGPAFAHFLPDPHMAARLQLAVGRVARRAADLDALLAQPAFDREATAARAAAFEVAGRTEAAAVARASLAHLERLAALQRAAHAEVAWAQELTQALGARAAMARYVGEGAADTAALVAELEGRIGALDEALEEPGLWRAGA